MDDNQPLVAQPPSMIIYSTAVDTPSTYNITDSEKGVQNLDPSALIDDKAHPSAQNSYTSDDNLFAQSTSYSTTLVANGCLTGDTKVDDMASVATDNLVGHETDASVPTHIVHYDSVNGLSNDIVDYHSSVVVEYGGASDISDAHDESQQFIEVFSPEEERLWDAVRVNCLDFNAWTTLIEETEKVAEANILKIRKVYDAFLIEFPLCFGYWKKYADHEARLHSANRVLEVYERAVLAVTYSVDIWLHYCTFAISIYEDPEIIRRLFERGLAYVGTDYLSYPMWDEYIRYEESQQAWSNLAMIYTRILESPIQQLDRYFNCFKDLAASRALSEIRTPEEAALVSASVENDLQSVHGEVVKLYERCMIACANYPEYWIRYVLCMEASGSMELAINALARATQVFVKKQPEIHLFAARFKERSGDILGAQSQYELIYSDIFPGLLEAIQRHVNMEYRLGNKEDALSIFEKAIATEREKEQSQILPMLFIMYSRFLYLVVGDAEKARDVFSGVLENAQLSKPILEASIHLESILPLPKRIDYIDMLVENFITPTAENCYMANTTDREDMSCILLEFLDLFGDSQSLKKAEDRHTSLFLRQKSTSVSKKRRADDFLASDKGKIAKGAPLAGQSVMGAYPNSQNQWQVGYGQKAPSWQGNPQAQGQTWNSGYPSQTGYGAYNYAGYGQPQIPASLPQGTLQGTYAPSYPAQAYTQQAYAQPATSAISSAAGFLQQPTAAVQPYYGSSYY